MRGRQSNLPVQRIEQVVRPNTQQQNALADLKKASEEAASDLPASARLKCRKHRWRGSMQFEKEPSDGRQSWAAILATPCAAPRSEFFQ
jgi:hypothetical protein